MEQANFATQTLKDTKTTVCNKSLTTQQNKGNFEMCKCKY